MHEHVAPAVYYLEVHLLYASIVCLVCWLLTTLWNGVATAKYWIWVATSLNFMVPLGGVFNGFGSARVSWATQLAGLDQIGIGISRHLTAGAVLLGVWSCGTAFMFARLWARLREERRYAETASRRDGLSLKRPFLSHGVPIDVAAEQGPCVDGVLRPHITLPVGIDRLLSASELEAVLIHEVTHARRRDNLIGLLQEISLCALWFHPLIWLTASRLAVFRELSCDEAVIARSRGADLIRALAKLADPGESHVLRAGAATLLHRRLACLKCPQPEHPGRLLGLVVIGIYVAVFLGCMVETIAHTPSCFKVLM